MHWLIDDLVSSRQLQTLQEKTIPQDLLIHAKIATIASIEIWEVPGGHICRFPRYRLKESTNADIYQPQIMYR